MSLLYDSDNPDNIPDGVNAAGYVNGYAGPPWLSRGYPRFPNARRISVFPGMNEGDTFDVEWLDITAEQAPAEVKAAHTRGIAVPWVYVNRSNRKAVENALIAASVMSDQVALWVATLDGTQTVPAGPYPVAAVQYLNAANSGGHYDISLVNDLYGPGAGSLGGNDLTPEQEAILKQALQAINDVNGGMFYAETDPTYGNFAKTFNDKIRAIVAAELAKVPASGGGTNPTKINLTISGTGTGSLS